MWSQSFLYEDAVQVTDAVGVAHLSETAGHGQVAGRQRLSTEYPRLLGKAMADAGGTHPQGRRLDDAAAAKSNADYVGHSEVGADAGHLHRHRRFPGEPVDEGAAVGGRAAHVHDDAVADAGEEGGAPHAVGGAGGDGENGIVGGEFRVHEGAVVLAQIEGRIEAEPAYGLRGCGGLFARRWRRERR